MKNLYGSIQISKMLEKGSKCINEKIDYYKLKNEKYGLEIVKTNNVNEENFEIMNITDNEEEIDKILNDLVIKEITPSSSDVIDDLRKIYAC